MDGDPPSKVGYRRATGKYMLTSRFTADDPNLPSGTTAANGRDGGLLSFAGARANGEVAPKPAVPLSWVERVKPSTSTLIQTRVRVSPDCFPSSRPGRDRERGTAMIYAGRFIPYRDRWCAADRRRSDGHPVPQALHFSNTEHCENLRQIPGASGPLSQCGRRDRRARRSLTSARFASYWSVRLLRP